MAVIMFDMDGCLCDFVRGFTELGNKLHGTPITTTMEQPSWSGFPGMNDNQIDATWRVIDDSGDFWYSLSPLCTQETLDKIDVLSLNHDTYFVTARHGYQAKEQTYRWLKDHGITRPTVVLSKRKAELAKAIRADYSVEDKAANASMVAWLTEDKCKSFLVNRPYNLVGKEFLSSGVRRVSSVRAYVDHINAEA